MKKTTTKGWMLFALAVLTGTTMMSCSSDDNIDLGELDTTIGVGSDGFTLPSSSTKDSPLGDLLDLNDSDVIDTLKSDSAGYKAGDYQFKKVGNDIEPAKPKVEQVKFNTSENEQNQNLPIKVFASMSSDAASDIYYFGDPSVYYNESDPTDLSKLANLKIESKAKPYEIKRIDFTGDGNDQIVKLVNATVDGTILLTLNVQALKGKVNNIYGIDLYLPKYLKLKSNSGYTYDITSNSDYNILKLQNISSSKPKVVHLQLDCLDDVKDAAPTTPAAQEKGYIVFNAKGMQMHCTIKMVMKLRRGDIANSFIPTTAAVNEDNINTVIDMGDGFAVTHAEGYFNPDIDINPDAVDINDIPDFLSDDRVNITLSNPTIKLEVDNNVEAEGIINGTMTASYSDGTKKILKINGIKMKRASQTAKSVIYICRKAGSKPGVQYVVLNQPGETATSDPKMKEVKDIAALLNRIPDKIEFEFDAEANHDYSDPMANPPAKFDLYKAGTEGTPGAHGLNYEIKPSYEFVAPLELEASSQIVYNDTIDDWNKDLQDNKIDFYQDGHVVVEATINNNTPLDLVIDNPKAIGVKDANGVAKQISEAKVEIVDENGKAKAGGITIYKQGDPMNTKLYLKVSGKIENLDGIIFEVVAKARAGAAETLNASRHTVQIKDVKIRLNGRVTIDLDK